VRVSLARTGALLAGLPELPAGAESPELPAGRLDELMTVTGTPFGRLRHLKPVAQLSETPAAWDLPTVPLDHDRPEWI
jgi:hypothetical protein